MWKEILFQPVTYLELIIYTFTIFLSVKFVDFIFLIYRRRENVSDLNRRIEGWRTYGTTVRTDLGQKIDIETNPNLRKDEWYLKNKNT